MHFQSIFFEDYILQDKRVTLGRTITETDFVVHAGHTGDFFPHHMDAEWCKSQSFGQRIAHGTMVFSIGIGLTASVINPEAFSKGYDRLRFVKSVFIGDTIHVEIIISEKSSAKNPEYGTVIEHVKVINQHNEVVLVADHILLAKRKSLQGME
ncbi:MaoC/PaaZ C-terminal domain-containing protein [Sphingobacterium cavernae]|uniref:MaoC/PaaZ C-terminal domain-containing protein n=1 Tax=Sphingobacterium cavernae TaxID=2592657 RepID=UPI001230211E|nr:MaoC/PaaZ C-terminal domain-containing protein [Sphingobacterium cavernae]